MPKDYMMGIAGTMTRASMRAGKRDGTACFLAYETDEGDLRFALGFSDGPGRPFAEIDLSEDELGVVETVFSTWETDSGGTLPWIDLVIVTAMSSQGPNGVDMGSSTIPRSFLGDRVRADGRRMAHAEPLEKQMEHATAVALSRRGRQR